MTRPRRRRIRRSAVWLTTVTVALGLGQATSAPVQAEPRDAGPALQAQPKPAPAVPPPPVAPRKPVDQLVDGLAKLPPTVSWPAAGTVELSVPAAGVRRSPALLAIKARAGGLPVAVAPPGVSADSAASDQLGKVRIETLERATSARAKVDGPVVVVTRADGKTAVGRFKLSVDYAGYAAAFGGDFGSRLRLVRLPQCALATPDAPVCAPEPVRSVNDTAHDTVTADVTVDGGATMFAVAAAEKSAQGSYGATALTASAKWNVTPSSGAFTWSYPLRVPPVPGGLTPGVTFGYNSQTVDGRTTDTNNQGSWLGEGFSFEPGYVERRYKPCQDDGHKEVGDLCWSHDNAMLVLNGRTSELVRSGNGWRFASDDGSKIERLTGAANGDDNGEYWQVTTVDGTQYFLGRNRLPGWGPGKPETRSAWTVPVFGDDSGEPCYTATFADAHCQQGWRWNLDYVKDRHGNVLSYFYERETNHYARGRKTDVNGVAYDRGGWLKRIDYGQRDGAVYSTNASARVVFDEAERCRPTQEQACRPDGLNANTASAWPDVPFDRHCAAGSKCDADQASPTFWTRKRLTKITTEIRSGDGWRPVDSWGLEHEFTNNADGSRSLWLHRIVHQGHVGGSLTMPSVEFGALQLPNRIEIPDVNIGPLIRPRLSTVYTDAGGQVDIRYAAADCSAHSLPSPGRSTKRCYPVKWHPDGEEEPITDWFHKYVVERITESDRTTVVPGTRVGTEMVTRYEYLGDAAWRHVKPDGINEKEYRTWSEWRGYEKVRVRKGAFDNLTTRSDHTYLRGMHGDKNPAGGTRTVTRTDSAGGSYTDHDELAGFEIETATFNGDAVTSKTITTPWRYQTASHRWTWGTDDAFFVLPETTRSFTALEGGRWRETRTKITYDPQGPGYPDPVGRVTQVEDLADVGTAADDRCTRTSYADNTHSYVRNLVARVETVAVHCGAVPDRSTQVISDDRTYYDGGAFGAAPTRGNVTKNEKLASHDGVTARHVTTGEGTFDGYGRPLTVRNNAGQTTTFAYTETDGLTTRKVETAPRIMVGMVAQDFTSTTEFAPAWGQPTLEVDWNKRRTEMAYDALGRVTSVWLPDRGRTLSPSIKYTYKTEDRAPVAVKTEKVKISGEYAAEYQIYDGMLRPRQIQTEGPEGGRLVAETFYTPTGKVARTHDTFFAVGRPSDQLLPTTIGDTQLQTTFLYDGADRVTDTITAVSGVEKWRTTTRYGGDRTHVDPPQGGTPTTTVTDARGQLTELLQYKSAGPTGDVDRTTYTYTPAGEPATVTGPGGNVWRHEYDQRGRKIATADPDTGRSTFSYNDLDQLVATTDARGLTVSHAYDQLGRKVATYQGPVSTGMKLAAWTYDRESKGQPYSATRYVNSLAYTITNAERDLLNRVTWQVYTIPKTAPADKLGGEYHFRTSYNRDGTVRSTSTSPQVGGLPVETFAYTYDDLQRLVGLSSSKSRYVKDMAYSHTGDLLRARLDTGGKFASGSYYYELGTKRMKQAVISRQQVVIPGEPAPSESVAVADEHYSYDHAGNVLQIADIPAGGQRDVQCFEYDHLRRMTQAWTSARESGDACAGGATATGVGGAAPYHHSYGYDDTGNRLSETLHGVAGEQATTRTYRYADVGGARSHQVTGVTESTPAGDRLYHYEYDASGNTTKRSNAGSDQALTWDAEGYLASVTDAGGTTSFLHSADGGRLVRQEPSATTLYLPGMELRQDHASGVVDGTRFVPVGDKATVVQTVKGMQLQFADHHGTGQVGLDAATGDVTRRRFTPFGAARGAPPSGGGWTGEKGFVGGTQDTSTGLTHLGAREYDPYLGRFISVDPLIDNADPQSMHGYVYSGNNPTSFSDPDGLMRSGEDMGGAPKIADPPAAVPTGGGAAPGQQVGVPANPDAVRARQDANEAKQMIVAVAKELGDIALQELGLKDIFTCFTTGELRACGETALTVAETFIGGVAAKLLRKYGRPDKWDDAYALSKRLWDLGGKLKDNVGKYLRSSRKADALEAAGKGCLPKNSFVPGTLVRLADGSNKAIEDVDVGDVVVATDAESGITAAKMVVATIIGDDSKDLVEVTLDVDGPGADAPTETIVATDGHPFWVADLGEWVTAAELVVGRQLQTSAGNWVEITELKRQTETTRVHNLTVDDIHTYYVLAGTVPVLVHNCGEGGAASSANGDRLRRQLAEEAGQLPGIRSADDIFDTPSALRGGVTPDQVRPFFAGRQGWVEEGLGRGRNAGGGWVIREYTSRGDPTGRMLRWNPGGGHHGEGAYWRVVGPQGDLGGIIR